jgi:hypothetical protein
VSRWGQVQKGDLSVGVMQHETRKSPAIVVHRGSVVYTVAYCRSEEEADRFMDALVEITGAVDGRDAA